MKITITIELTKKADAPAATTQAVHTPPAAPSTNLPSPVPDSGARLGDYRGYA